MQDALLMKSEHSKANLNQHLEHVRFLNRPVCASFCAQKPLQVSILAKLHHNVDFSFRYERVVVFDGVWVVHQLPV